jgi:uncharacterized membrane protein YkoI
MRKHFRPIIALFTCAVLLGVGAIGASASNGNGSNNTDPGEALGAVKSHALNLADRLGISEDESQVAPGTIDDGRDLLPQAKITVEQAIEAAQNAQTGAIGEIDLEHFKGHLVFNVDVGDKDVKVDAEDGTVLSLDSDD